MSARQEQMLVRRRSNGRTPSPCRRCGASRVGYGHVSVQILGMTVKVCPKCRREVLDEQKRPKLWPLQAAPAPSNALRLWDLAEARVQLHEAARLYLQTRLAAAGRYAGSDYKALRKTTHRGAQRSDYAASPTLDQLRRWGADFGIPLEDLEAGVAWAHSGNHRQGIMGPFPRSPNRHWAFLAGVYAGAGALQGREEQVRLMLAVVAGRLGGAEDPSLRICPSCGEQGAVGPCGPSPGACHGQREVARNG